MIGSLLPLTGTLQTFGPDMERAVEMAIEDVNDAGGILGREVQHVSGDSRTDPAQAPQAFQRLVQDGVVAVVGAASSGVTGSILGQAVDNGIVVVSPASTSPALTDRDNQGFFWRVPPNDALQGKVMAELLADHDIRTISTIFVNNDYGQGFNNVLKQEALTRYQIVTVNEVPFDDKSTTFQSEIQSASTGEPDAIVYIGYPGTGVPLMSQAHNAGATDDMMWFFSEGVFDQSFLTDVGEDEEGNPVLEGFMGTTPAFLTGVGTSTSFADRFESTYDHAPGLFAAQSYDAAMSIMLAIQAANSADPADFKDFMMDVYNAPGPKVSMGDLEDALERAADGQDIDYRGVSGDFDWNDAGDPVRGVYATWRVDAANEIEIVETGIEKSL